jgi:hypothetical protein
MTELHDAEFLAESLRAKRVLLDPLQARGNGKVGFCTPLLAIAPIIESTALDRAVS